MSKWSNHCVAVMPLVFGFFLSTVLFTGAIAANHDRPKHPGIGRDATPAEVRAWDIDVRPDFKGLPIGTGSVAQGQLVWEGKCESCHGTFGESNAVFTPIIGGTTQQDIVRGRVAGLRDEKNQRTTLMRVATVSTLWDFIHRAMPWKAPRSLSVDETYAVLAFLLNLADIVPSDFVLSNINISEVQEKMPNRNGMTLQHGLWSVSGKPDVNNVACMQNCPTSARITSFLPDKVRNANGNLLNQHRTYGPYRGVDTSKAPLPNLPSNDQDPKILDTLETVKQ